MPTADPSNVLFKIAHPDLYERNPFNVLNLSVSATARDIRRRREDIEAAFDAGTEAEEFAGILPADDGRKPPTRAEVADLFAALEDPERRIAYALFWFWPTGKAEKIRNPNESIREFLAMFDGNLEESLSADGIRAPLEGRHNLAVFHHMAALAGERASIRSSQTDKHWYSTIAGWNALVSDSDFWHSVSELVSALGDPRLDYKFARSLRDQFAFAFDQINVELAIGYAKTGRETDAKRQVGYMKQSQPDSDDVEGTFDDAFAGLLRQTEAVVDAALAETKANPKDGLRQANAILSQTDEPLRVSRIVLEKGSSLRNAIVSAIFGGVRGCLVAYGNETKDWDECLKLTVKLKGIAETEEQGKKVEEDINTCQKNVAEDSIVRDCWICKRKTVYGHSCLAVTVPIHGEFSIIAEKNSVSYKKGHILVPVCSSCISKKGLSGKSSYRDIPDVVTHPFVKEMILKGWRIGEEMTQEEVDDILQDYLEEQEYIEDELQKLMPRSSLPIGINSLISRYDGTNSSLRKLQIEQIQKTREMHIQQIRKKREELFKTTRDPRSRFHNWCKAYSQVLLNSQCLSAAGKKAVVSVLFEMLKIEMTDILAVAEFINKTFFYNSGVLFSNPYIRGDLPPRHIYHEYFSKTFYNGYALILDVFYDQHPWLFPCRFHVFLGERIANQKYPFSLFSISSPEYTSGGYAGGVEKVVLEIKFLKEHVLGLCKSFGSITLTLDVSPCLMSGKHVKDANDYCVHVRANFLPSLFFHDTAIPLVEGLPIHEFSSTMCVDEVKKHARSPEEMASYIIVTLRTVVTRIVSKIESKGYTIIPKDKDTPLSSYSSRKDHLDLL